MSFGAGVNSSYTCCCSCNSHYSTHKNAQTQSPQIAIPDELADEAACQALINPIPVVGMFQEVGAAKGESCSGVMGRYGESLGVMEALGAMGSHGGIGSHGES